MQKLLFATAVALSSSLASCAAPAAGASNGAFVHAGMGKTRYITEVKPFNGKQGASFDLLVGYRWGLGRDFGLGAEAGFAQLGSVDHRFPAVGKKLWATQNLMHATAWLTGVNARWNLTEQLALVGRVGIAHVKTRFSHRPAGSKKATHRESILSRTPYFGIGIGYAVAEHVELTLQATRYDNQSIKTKRSSNSGLGWSATTYNAGMEYRF
jgi:outer membrane immunogenic protein